jgi:predicted transcriptional regulator
MHSPQISSDRKGKAHYILYFKGLTKIMKETKKKRYSTLSQNLMTKIRATWKFIRKERGKVHSVEQVPALRMNDGQLQDPK